MLALLLGFIYGSVLIINAVFFINFFKLNDSIVTQMAVSYLKTASIGTIFMFMNPVFSGFFNGSGDSKTPFYINSIGLVINIVFDPILIFGLVGFPAMGVLGAAIATVFSQFVVSVVFITTLAKRHFLFSEFCFFSKPDFSILKRILKLGAPVAGQSASFTIFAILLARIITKWGPIPIAVQKVGAQIEAISWMTANGFSSALSAFVGQNFGAKLWNRIQQGYFAALASVSVVGVFATILLVFFAEPIFKLFIPDAESVKYGISYLQILGLSQLFMCVEITTSGAFNGLGKTAVPSIIGIVFTGLRVPVAIMISTEALLGLNGIWWSISMSSVVKGVILVVWFIIFLRKVPELKDINLIRLLIYRFESRYVRDKSSLQGK